jgi:hypothetical protein
VSDSTTSDARQGLASKWVVPPFSVLDSRSGRWQARKRLWLARGVGVDGYSDPETRGSKTFGGGGDGLGFPGRSLRSRSSEFDPVLAEALIHWFSDPGDLVIDPFAGGPVRGVVAHTMGRRYVGADIRSEQVEHNRASFAGPSWIVADAIACPFDGMEAGMVLTCPPYGPLEKYSDDPGDLANMSKGAFVDALSIALAEACASLRAGGFAVVVVGDYRDKSGELWGIPDVARAGLRSAAGMVEHARLVFFNRAGSAPVRAGKQMIATRTPVTTHQDVLAFVKGRPKRHGGSAPIAIGPSQIGLFDGRRL